jgi:hypothetical protein
MESTQEPRPGGTTEGRGEKTQPVGSQGQGGEIDAQQGVWDRRLPAAATEHPCKPSISRTGVVIGRCVDQAIRKAGCKRIQGDRIEVDAVVMPCRDQLEIGIGSGNESQRLRRHSDEGARLPIVLQKRR